MFSRRREFFTLESDIEHALAVAAPIHLFSKMRAYKIAKSLVGRHALIAIFATSLAITLSNRVKARQASEPELAVKVSYDRFENVTVYETSSMELAAQDKQRYGGSTVDLAIAFACRGNTGQKPCMPQQVTLRFSHSVWKAYSANAMENGGDESPFNYNSRSVIAIADGENIRLGDMSVRSQYDSLGKGTSWYGELNIDLPHIATARCR